MTRTGPQAPCRQWRPRRSRRPPHLNMGPAGVAASTGKLPSRCGCHPSRGEAWLLITYSTRSWPPEAGQGKRKRGRHQVGDQGSAKYGQQRHQHHHQGKSTSARSFGCGQPSSQLLAAPASCTHTQLLRCQHKHAAAELQPAAIPCSLEMSPRVSAQPSKHKRGAGRPAMHKHHKSYQSHAPRGCPPATTRQSAARC